MDGEVVGEIDRGLLVLLGVEKDDDEAKAKRLMERVTTYRQLILGVQQPRLFLGNGP